MSKTIQRGCIFFTSMIFALAVGMASAAQDDDDDDDDGTPRECYWKHETQEICYTNKSTGQEKCVRRTTVEWECTSISDTPP